jgi:hypothetical protein
MPRAALALALVLLSTPALADSIPSCPPGTHRVAHPTSPGARHHGGFSCVPDEAPANPLPEGPAPTAPPPVDPAPTAPAPTATPSAEEAATPPTAATPAPSSGLCSASSSSTDALALGTLSALLALVLRRVRMA